LTLIKFGGKSPKEFILFYGFLRTLEAYAGDRSGEARDNKTWKPSFKNILNSKLVFGMSGTKLVIV